MLILDAKPEIISIMVCPAIMFAARRIARLIGLVIYVKNSINTIIGASHHGVPDGRKFFAKPSMPLFAIIEAVTLMKTIIDNVPVTIN